MTTESKKPVPKRKRLAVPIVEEAPAPKKTSRLTGRTPRTSPTCTQSLSAKRTPFVSSNVNTAGLSR